MIQRLSTSIIFLVFALFIYSCDLSSVEDKSEAPFPCVNGSANGYACENVDLFSQVSIYDLSGDSTDVSLNDIWGWTDPQTGKEYALVGLTNGTSFVDISDPANPVVVGRLPQSNLSEKFKQLTIDNYPACNLGIGATEWSKSITDGTPWRDIKIYENHAYIVSDAQPHGMQVFDLTKLRDHDSSVIEFDHDALYDKFGPAHNIVINTKSGFAYATGVTQSEICGSRDSTGLHLVDINDPKSPKFAGCYIDSTPGNYRIAPGYIHDAQCVIYEGPDGEHNGKEVCFNSAEGNVVIADVSDKENPVTLGYERQANMQYSHQGWLTDDQAYFLMNDELDERNLGRNTKTYVWDVQDLDNPTFVGYYDHETFSIDHNLYVRGDHVFESNYNAGLQILEISDLENAEFKRVAYFDTQPQTDEALFKGTWSNYPYFASGVVVISDIDSGLFIVRPEL